MTGFGSIREEIKGKRRDDEDKNGTRNYAGLLLTEIIHIYVLP